MGRFYGLLNRAIVDGHAVTWWWLASPTADDAKATEAMLIHGWAPPWNRAHPLRC